MRPIRPLPAAALAGAFAGLVAMTAPAAAQTDRDLSDVPEQLDRMMDELMDRMRPALDDLFGLFEVMDRIDSPSNYDKPVILPNGDILIPRAPDAPEWQPDWETEPDFTPRRPLERLPGTGDSART